MAKVIGGKLAYVKMVKEAENSAYLKLKERFYKVLPVYNKISKILDIWESGLRYIG